MSAGASSADVDLSSCAGMLSGPDALCGCRLSISVVTPLLWTVMPLIGLYGLVSSTDKFSVLLDENKSKLLVSISAIIVIPAIMSICSQSLRWP